MRAAKIVALLLGRGSCNRSAVDVHNLPHGSEGQHLTEHRTTNVTVAHSANHSPMVDDDHNAMTVLGDSFHRRPDRIPGRNNEVREISHLRCPSRSIVSSA